MKRLLLAVLFVLLLAASSFAELSIVWDQIYDQIETEDICDFVALGNGEFICFVTVDEGNGDFVHAIRLTMDGTIVDDHTFSHPIGAPRHIYACESPDGGAYLFQRLSGSFLISRWNAAGILIEHHRMSDSMMYWVGDIECTSDNTLILTGSSPDIVCISLNGEEIWSHNFPEGREEGSSLTETARSHSGLFLGEGLTWSYSVNWPFSAVFTSAGAILGQRVGYYRYVDKWGLVVGPNADEPVFIKQSHDAYNSRYLRKRSEWSWLLPSSSTSHEYWKDVDAFRGEAGYLVVGYFEDPGPDSGYLIQAAEADGDTSIVIVPERHFQQSVAAFDGSMLVAGQEYDSDTQAWVLTLTQVAPPETHLPVSVGQWINEAPRRLSADGGTVYYRSLIANDLDSASPITFVRTLQKPGEPDSLLAEWTQALAPGIPITATRQQLDINDSQPAGEYRLILEAFDQDDNLLSHNHEIFWKLGASEPTDRIETTASVSPSALASVYPNPFNAATTINVTLPETAPLTVRVFDIQGRTVATLADGGSISAGSHAFTFDGSTLSSGIYFVQATVPGQLNEVRKLMLVK